MDQVRLNSVAEVLDALGGDKAVAALTSRSLQAVCNWRERGGIPARTFLVMCRALKRHGKTANSSLWSMDEPEGVES